MTHAFHESKVFYEATIWVSGMKNEEKFKQLRLFLLLKMLKGRLHRRTFMRVIEEPHYFILSEVPAYEKEITALGKKMFENPNTFGNWEFYEDFDSFFQKWESEISAGRLTVTGLWDVFFTRRTLSDVMAKNPVYQRVERRLLVA